MKKNTKKNNTKRASPLKSKSKIGSNSRSGNSKGRTKGGGVQSKSNAVGVKQRVWYPIIGDPKADLEALIEAYCLDYRFSKTALAEADNVSGAVTDEQIKGRHDFRGDCVVTIDGADAKDLDDAIEVVRTATSYRLSVHIADVAEYVVLGGALDKEAYERGTSVYFPDMVLPMLPKSLSNGICSLNPHVDRLVVSCIMDFDRGGRLTDSRLAEGVIKTRHRMTYTGVQDIIDNKQGAADGIEQDVLLMLGAARELAAILYDRRIARGMIEFDLPESKIVLGQDGRVESVAFAPRLIAHRIIEEFMLAANETVAQTACTQKTPIIYRSHESPPSEKATNFENFLTALGISFGRNITTAKPGDWAKFLRKLEGQDIEKLVQKIALRSMAKASYEPNNRGHFGLSAEYYCHFTSPIRRYPDLATHRVVKEMIRASKSGNKPDMMRYKRISDDIAKVSSARERRAEDASRRVDDLKKAEYMSAKIGETFEGTISSVTDFGVFVELDNSCEGLCRIDDLPPDSYRVDVNVYRVTGKKYRYSIGDRVMVRVQNVTGDKVGFEVLGNTN